MKRVKTISGKNSHSEMAITIEITSSNQMSRNGTQQMMDAVAGEIMKLFERGIPYFAVPLVRLKVK